MATTAALPTAPIVLCDVEDLAEADLEADLAERLELAGWVWLRSDGAGAAPDEVGRLVSGTGPRPGSADAVSLAWAIRRGGAAAAAVHDLGLKAAILAG
ncbi:hypothetical protein E4P41_10005 [Geodermatophilus sp. DF01-2]|uniref:hypothetical protein n=1 Tax=Geodermatophilus sp. DF01-2 TaxID=2559610 RepID=UPI0010730DBE|nr:hypothetical protein [Geodermatophilus sp. DF01_2]TFV61241.1 hypothetical protein E4P41_10005 [Geodermatophilus sp. DF01_2]